MQARLLGGGSAINGMHAQRGFARDYDEWSEYGLHGWGWDDVRPYFIKLESDRDFNGQDHGSRSEEHTSELQSLMRTSYAVFCLKKKTHTTYHTKLALTNMS